ncbi:MAG: hypothetical protein ACPGVD_10045, partial [Flavobacteriales bacterium]
YTVLYAGYDNIIEASISGYSPSDIRVSCTGGTITKKGNQYVIKTGSAREVEVRASAPGTVVVRKYKVLSKPKPELFFAGKQFGNIRIGQVKQGKKLVIKSPNSSPLRIGYEIVSFDFEVVANNKLSDDKLRSANLSAKSLSMLNRIRKGNKIFISNVRYKETGSNKVKSINGLSLKVI